MSLSSPSSGLAPVPAGRTWRGCVFIGVSLDGYIARADGSLDWLTDPEPRPHAGGDTAHPALVWETFFPTVGALVMGRSTYETVSGFPEWPFGELPVIVLSRTLEPGADARVRVADSVSAAAGMLEALGADRVYVDGGRTVQAFLEAGLVDEITVSIAPVLLGGGRRLFGDLDRELALTLRGHHSSAEGLLRATYDVAPR